MNSLSGISAIAGPILSLVLIPFGLVMTILWIVLPFAVIGMKPLLRELIAETKRTNALLQAQAATHTRSHVGHVASELSAFRAER